MFFINRSCSHPLLIRSRSSLLLCRTQSTAASVTDTVKPLHPQQVMDWAKHVHNLKVSSRSLYSPQYHTIADLQTLLGNTKQHQEISNGWSTQQQHDGPTVPLQATEDLTEALRSLTPKLPLLFLLHLHSSPTWEHPFSVPLSRRLVREASDYNGPTLVRALTWWIQCDTTSPKLKLSVTSTLAQYLTAQINEVESPSELTRLLLLLCDKCKVPEIFVSLLLRRIATLDKLPKRENDGSMLLLQSQWSLTELAEWLNREEVEMKVDFTGKSNREVLDLVGILSPRQCLALLSRQRPTPSTRNALRCVLDRFTSYVSAASTVLHDTSLTSPLRQNLNEQRRRMTRIVAQNKLKLRTEDESEIDLMTLTTVQQHTQVLELLRVSLKEMDRLFQLSLKFFSKKSSMILSQFLSSFIPSSPPVQFRQWLTLTSTASPPLLTTAIAPSFSRSLLQRLRRRFSIQRNKEFIINAECHAGLKLSEKLLGKEPTDETKSLQSETALWLADLCSSLLETRETFLVHPRIQLSLFFLLLRHNSQIQFHLPTREFQKEVWTDVFPAILTKWMSCSQKEPELFVPLLSAVKRLKPLVQKQLGSTEETEVTFRESIIAVTSLLEQLEMTLSQQPSLSSDILDRILRLDSSLVFKPKHLTCLMPTLLQTSSRPLEHQKELLYALALQRLRTQTLSGKQHTKPTVDAVVLFQLLKTLSMVSVQPVIRRAIELELLGRFKSLMFHLSQHKRNSVAVKQCASKLSPLLLTSSEPSRLLLSLLPSSSLSSQWETWWCLKLVLASVLAQNSDALGEVTQLARLCDSQLTFLKK